jgi:cell wall-associated NlpC family hydrolase
MNIQTDVVSHAAIYLGNGLILHHLRSRISKKDHATSWKKFFNTVVRYNG